MPLHPLYFKLVFRLRERFTTLVLGRLRRAYWRTQGMKIGIHTAVPHMHVTWPHQVKIGKDCRLEHDIYFHFDGTYQPGPRIMIGESCFIGSGCEFNIVEKISIGKHCQIASGSRFIDHDHGMKPGLLIAKQSCSISSITVSDDVWVGANALILKGAHIGTGAVVGAGAVVIGEIPPYAVVAGVPAKVIRFRSQPGLAVQVPQTGF